MGEEGRKVEEHCRECIASPAGKSFGRWTEKIAAGVPQTLQQQEIKSSHDNALQLSRRKLHHEIGQLLIVEGANTGDRIPACLGWPTVTTAASIITADGDVVEGSCILIYPM